MKNPAVLRSFLLLVFSVPTAALANLAADVEARAKFFNEHLRAPVDLLNSPIGKPLAGVRNVKTVLPGVLYRAGGPGGHRDIPDAGLKTLCEAGFAKAYYLYPNGFSGERTIRCEGPDGKPNAIEYVQVGYVEDAHKIAILRDIHRRAQDPYAGPALVHCWNGYHASGEIAAVALKQFCGYETVSANAYWMKNQVGANLISRIRKFTESSELRVPTDIRDALCPRGN